MSALDHLVHGTIDGYRNHGCRCDECRRANTDYRRIGRQINGLHVPLEEYKAQRRATAEARNNHGTEYRYNRGCRCRECKDGNAAARRRRRARAKLSTDQTLEWLLHWPAYRELIRQRVSEEQKRRRRIDSRIRYDIDRIGLEVDGCG